MEPTTSSYITPEFTLEIEQRWESVNTMAGGSYQPDPKWMYTDHAGHDHTGELWTCEWFVSHTIWDEYDGEINFHKLRCRLCYEIIEPGKVWVPDPPPIPTVRVARLTTPDGRIWHLSSDERDTLGVRTPEEIAALVMQRDPDMMQMVFGKW